MLLRPPPLPTSAEPPRVGSFAWQEWGVDLSAASPTPATLAYTSFVLDIANGPGGVPLVLAAMAPCMRLYSFVGCRIASDVPASTGPRNPYAEWVKTYSSSDFQVRIRGGSGAWTGAVLGLEGSRGRKCRQRRWAAG